MRNEGTAYITGLSFTDTRLKTNCVHLFHDACVDIADLIKMRFEAVRQKMMIKLLVVENDLFLSILPILI